MSTFVRVTKIFFNKMKKINSHTSFLFVFWVFVVWFFFERERMDVKSFAGSQSVQPSSLFFTFSTIYWTLFNQTSCFYGDIL